MILPDDLRVLTVKQPWAGLIIDGIKDVENRSWAFPATLELPCLIAIHAGAKLDPKTTATGFPTRAVVGLVYVVGCHKREATGTKCHRCTSPWGIEDQHHWMLADPIKFLQPIEATGKMGLMPVAPEVRAAIERYVNP